MIDDHLSWENEFFPIATSLDEWAFVIFAENTLVFPNFGVIGVCWILFMPVLFGVFNCPRFWANGEILQIK